MDNSTVALVCGLTALAVVIILLVALVLLRVVRFGVFGFANLILRMLTEPKDEADVAAVQPPVAPVSGDDLRSLAGALDFDAAVEKARREQQAKTSDAVIEPKPFTADPPPLTPTLPDVKTPITGRILRDGRYRRMAAGTPGRERDEDFRRPEGGDEPVEGA